MIPHCMCALFKACLVARNMSLDRAKDLSMIHPSLNLFNYVFRITERWNIMREGENRGGRIEKS